MRFEIWAIFTSRTRPANGVPVTKAVLLSKHANDPIAVPRHYEESLLVAANTDDNWSFSNFHIVEVLK